MKFRCRTEVLDKIPNKYNAVIALSIRVKMLVEGKKRMTEQNDENYIKIAMEEIASGALHVEVGPKPK